MSDAQLEQLGAELQEQQGEEEPQQPENEAPQFSETERKAFDQGWRPKEEFSGDPENWKTAKQYIKDGEMIQQLKTLQNQVNQQRIEFDSRLENANKLQQARAQREIERLKKEQLEAVDNADKGEFERIQGQIDDLSQPPAQEQAPQKSAEVVEWEGKNPWIFNPNDDRTAIANALFGNFLKQNPGATTQQALDHIDKTLAKTHGQQEPPQNMRRNQPNVAEQSGSPRRGGKSRELTMNDLTPEERQEWNSFGRAMFGDEKAYLKAVSDARKGA